MKRYAVGLFVFSTLLSFSISKAEDSKGESQDARSLTVYSTADPASFDPQQFIAQQRQGYNPQFASQVPGYAIVKEIRPEELKQGLNELSFTDVAQFIDPTTVSIADLTDPDGTTVGEQNFQFDLASAEKIIEKYIDKPITVLIPHGEKIETLSGTLLSAAGNELVLKTPDGIQLVNRSNPQIKLGELPGGLITKPTLVWKLFAKKGGAHKLRTAYQTDGITWRADYNLVVNAADTKADIGAWVSLMNLSGSAFQDAKLKLIAGDVQRVAPTQAYPRNAMAKASGMMLDEAAPQGFTEKSFFEYHLYTLPQKIDVLSNTTQQIMLFPTARDVGVEKVLVYYGAPQPSYWSYNDSPQTDRDLGVAMNKKVDVYLRFNNEEKNHMGMPLPKGKVRVFKQDDADGTLEFIGEDLIDHTPRDEKVLIKLGQAFDVVGERKQTNYTIDFNGHVITESFSIELKNHKDAAQKVIVKENLYRWVNWQITEKSDDFEKIDARTVHFNLTVPAKGKKTLTYSVKYTW